jgi:hypothetical protein
MKMKAMKLPLKEEKFCQIYTTQEEFFGNGTRAYLKAFDLNENDPKALNVAKSLASRLLAKVNVLKRINELLDLSGFNSVTADKQTMYCMLQNNDLNAKMRAVEQHNKVKGRIEDKVRMQGMINGEIKHTVGIEKKDRAVLKSLAEVLVKAAALHR